MACAAWALGEAGVDLVDATVSWDRLVAAGRVLVLHDSLCPMTPPSFIAACVERARTSGRPVVGVRPVTDTVKVVDHDRVGETLDRESLVAVVSPLVLPEGVLAGLDARPSADLAQAVSDLAAAGHQVQTLVAPPEGRRVTSVEDVRVLDALTSGRP